VRWACLAVGAVWLVRGTGVATSLSLWILGSAAVYSAALTALQRAARHPPLAVVWSLDVTILTCLLILREAAAGNAAFVYAFLVLVLTLAYGWRGAALGLAGYALSEGVLLLPGAGPPVTWGLAVRAGSIGAGALVFGALVERHEALRRLAHAATDPPCAAVHDLHSFTGALEFLHKLAVRGRWPYSVLVVDIARPGIESSYKNPGIDEGVLEQLALEARAALRSTDIVGRVGADVFAVALPDTPRSGAELVARRVGERLQGLAPQLRVVVGCADLTPGRRASYDDCLHAAFADVRQVKKRSIAPH
jgi:GGDEF domain-containing protein